MNCPVIDRELSLWPAPERSQPSFDDGTKALNEIGVLGVTGNDLSIFLPVRCVFSFELLDFLAQAFYAFGRCEYRGCFGYYAVLNVGRAAQQFEPAGIETVFRQAFIWTTRYLKV